MGSHPCSELGFGGMCPEPEHVPDALHSPRFRPMVLEPGARYSPTTIIRLSVDPD